MKTTTDLLKHLVEKFAEHAAYRIDELDTQILKNK